ncbi:MarR family winged helix-turn-helix transcriptional regulator [Butyricicoccus sp.]|uniref:MarR family winged helix-turn-helix transcriptional regulator n=1 Tax=Butyricicoccus sp. TaxID=2049021 RepID=UPI003D7C8114
MAKELVEMQMENARQLSWIADCIAARGEAQILLMLAHRNEAVCAGELTEHVGLTSGRVANILKQLERKEYIERTPGTDDRRKVLVCLTENGQQYAKHVYKKELDGYAWLLRVLGEADAREFMRLLKQGVNLLGAHHDELFQMPQG